MHASAAIGNEAEIRARGEQIYKESCLSCHGVGGVGVKDHYADALVGDSTVGELTKLVAETMPEENPESCVGDDAAAVASYIHHSFYSEAAQVRNRPPRIRLARLTGEQLRQSLAGIYAAFGDNPWLEDKYGAQGLYFDGTRWKDDKRKIKRIDPVVDFDFGDKGPGKGVNPKEFYIQWSGSIKPDRSGKYEIVVRSTCSFVMDFGRDKRELINNHVQSEGRTEFRRTVYLTGHRPLMFKIDFYQRKRKTKQPPASLSLSWVPPGGVEEIIPQRNLLPTGIQQHFRCKQNCHQTIAAMVTNAAPTSIDNGTIQPPKPPSSSPSVQSMNYGPTTNFGTEKTTTTTAPGCEIF